MRPAKIEITTPPLGQAIAPPEEVYAEGDNVWRDGKPRACIVCGALTQHVTGRRRASGRWKYKHARCADHEACAQRRASR